MQLRARGACDSDVALVAVEHREADLDVGTAVDDLRVVAGDRAAEDQVWKLRQDRYAQLRVRRGVAEAKGEEVGAPFRERGESGPDRSRIERWKIGGGGERKTLRLVAKYADACNLFPTPELPHKLDVLRQHCEREGRDYDDIEKTVITSFDVGPNGEKVDALLTQLRGLADLGVAHVHGRPVDAWNLEQITVLGERVIPVIADW